MDKKPKTGIDEDRVKRHDRMLETVKVWQSEGDKQGLRVSPLGAAFIEDEAVRLTAEQNARDYVIQCEAEKNEMPMWMWYLLFFLLGMLFWASIDPAGTMIQQLIDVYNGAPL